MTLSKLSIIPFTLALLVGCGAPPKPEVTPTPTPQLSLPTTSSRPAPSNTAKPTDTPKPTPAGTLARQVLDALVVKGRAPKTGYSREQFGQTWADVDLNGCNTRDDILKKYLRDIEFLDGSKCFVASGTLDDPYSGTVIPFSRGGSSEVDIDHVIALSNAWQTGAFEWSPLKRQNVANDPLNLLPVSASLNRAKGDADAASWLPPVRSYRCEYVARQIAVKQKYGLWVTQAEKDAMVGVLESCPDQTLPDAFAPLPTTKLPTTPSRPTLPNPTSPALDPEFSGCGAAREAGYGPYRRGIDPEYEFYNDGDNDGVVCEI